MDPRSQHLINWTMKSLETTKTTKHVPQSYLIIGSMPELPKLWKPSSPGNHNKIIETSTITDRESRKLNAIFIQKPYIIEAPSTEDNHTVKSPPQVAYLTSDTRQRTGDDSISTQDKARM